MRTGIFTLCAMLVAGCGERAANSPKNEPKVSPASSVETPLPVPKKTVGTIHVFVALCDNEHQGIVPVPKKLGNGEDPGNNLYWGAMYGVKSFLKKSGNWILVVEENNPTDDILERAVFKHARKKVYLVADAYRGVCIKKAISRFLLASAGGNKAALKVGNENLGLNGCADLTVYVGHNGLMDFNVERPARGDSEKHGNAMVLACKSKPYFLPLLSRLGCEPLLLTTGFMAPEAYTLDAAVDAWISGADSAGIREKAARAYNRYQKCGLNGARRLFFSGKL